MIQFLLSIQFPLWVYLVGWCVVSLGVVWFGFIAGQEKRQRLSTEQSLNEAYNELEACDVDLSELEHDYATMGLLLEEHTQQFADVHRLEEIVEQRLQALEQRSMQVFLLPGQEVSSQEQQALPETPLPEWLKDVEGLDQL